MNCSICNSSSTEVIFHCDACIFQCNNCTHVFSDPDSIKNAEVYSQEYYAKTHRNWFANPNFPLFAWINDQLFLGTRSILDVGCGKGALLRYLREQSNVSLQLLGVDYSPNKPEEGIEYKQGDFTQMLVEDMFDVVTSLAVIEHVDDPVYFAKSLAKHCKPGGVVIVMTLDNDSLLYVVARILAKFGVRGPVDRLYSAHHLQHFTTKSLKKALENAGLTAIKTYHHNAPIAAIDIPTANLFVRSVMMIGVKIIFLFGQLTNRTYLQTIVATKLC
jgi:2-polyprenyl-3-methyl-5-hydroxy-6-metoxy-1,4-benzoquinol methylase